MRDRFASAESLADYLQQVNFKVEPIGEIRRVGYIWIEDAVTQISHNSENVIHHPFASIEDTTEFYTTLFARSTTDSPRVEAPGRIRTGSHSQIDHDCDLDKAGWVYFTANRKIISTKPVTREKVSRYTPEMRQRIHGLDKSDWQGRMENLAEDFYMCIEYDQDVATKIILCATTIPEPTGQLK